MDNGKEKRQYATAIFDMALGRQYSFQAPLSFGKGNTKGRIVNIMKYKKSSVLASIVAVLIISSIGIACGTSAKSNVSEVTEEKSAQIDKVYIKPSEKVEYNHESSDTHIYADGYFICAKDNKIILGQEGSGVWSIKDYKLGEYGEPQLNVGREYDLFFFKRQGSTYFAFDDVGGLEGIGGTYGVGHLEEDGPVWDLLLYNPAYSDGNTIYDCTKLGDTDNYYEEGIELVGLEDTDEKYRQVLEEKLLEYGIGMKQSVIADRPSYVMVIDNPIDTDCRIWWEDDSMPHNDYNMPVSGVDPSKWKVQAEL